MSQNTVAKLLEEAGDMAIRSLAELGDLTIKKIQADELHAFIAAREFNVEGMKAEVEGAGTVWTYLAVCAETKLILAYHLGDQTLTDATLFAKKIAKKLKRGRDGNFAARPTIVTDGLQAYPEAFAKAFGSDLNFGVLTKRYTKVDANGNRLPGSRYKGAVREVKQGQIDNSDIHTSYVERQNHNVRMGIRRYARKSNAFSKKLLNHERHLALWIMYHNLCWLPRPVRPRKSDVARGNCGWKARPPAAIAAGLETRRWAIEDLLALTDAFTAERSKHDLAAPTAPAPAVEPVTSDAPTHWVYWSRAHKTAKVHQAECTKCRGGRGRLDGPSKAGQWHPFRSLEEAMESADRLSQGDHSTCNICIGTYRVRDYWGRGT